MNKSESITELAKALNKFQAECSGAKKGAENPYFDSKYASLEEVINCAKVALDNNGLAVSQFPVMEQGYAGVETILMHESGEWISNKLLLACKKQDPQAMGSAITYARRYSYQSVLGIPSEDDDGEKSMQRGSSAPQMTQAPKITPVQSQELISLFQSKGALAGDAFMKHLKDNFGADKFANLDATQFTAVKGQLEGIQ